jgi:hypothetical protein
MDPEPVVGSEISSLGREGWSRMDHLDNNHLDFSVLDDDNTLNNELFGAGTTPTTTTNTTVEESMQTKQMRIFLRLLMSMATIFIMRILFSTWIVNTSLNIIIPGVMKSVGANMAMFRPITFSTSISIVLLVFVLFPSKV